MRLGLQMRWRPLLATLAGLLLPIPLILAVGAGRIGPWESAVARDAQAVSPVLTIDERRALLTFERPCQGAADCEPPLGCVTFSRGQALCMASECQTDLQCSEGFTCQALRSRGQGPRVRLCLVRGLADEGAPCFPSFTLTREMVCREGLLCNNGYCGRPCQPDTPESCPRGSFCADNPGGASCLPTCEDGTCAQGQECVRFEREISVCARILGENCQRQPCPEDTRCSVGYVPQRPGEIEMECRAVSE